MELRALTPPHLDSGMSAGLRRAGRMFTEVRTVIDVGAAAGKWTRLALPHFPGAQFLLLEPLRERVGVLEALRAEHANVQYVSAAAGAARGEASFHVAEDLDGSGVRPSGSGDLRNVPVTTLDEEISRLALPGPYFVKLDTHGFEVPILQGAERIFQDTCLLMIEAYNFKTSELCLRFHELCAWLEPRGFRPLDLLDPLRRPGDEVLWQIDLVFARHDHPAFAHAVYQ